MAVMMLFDGALNDTVAQIVAQKEDAASDRGFDGSD
jgi:hypothetical protein